MAEYDRIKPSRRLKEAGKVDVSVHRQLRLAQLTTQRRENRHLRMTAKRMAFQDPFSHTPPPEAEDDGVVDQKGERCPVLSDDENSAREVKVRRFMEDLCRDVMGSGGSDHSPQTPKNVGLGERGDLQIPPQTPPQTPPPLPPWKSLASQLELHEFRHDAEGQYWRISAVFQYQNGAVLRRIMELLPYSAAMAPPLFVTLMALLSNLALGVSMPPRMDYSHFYRFLVDELTILPFLFEGLVHWKGDDPAPRTSLFYLLGNLACESAQCAQAQLEGMPRPFWEKIMDFMNPKNNHSIVLRDSILSWMMACCHFHPVGEDDQSFTRVPLPLNGWNHRVWLILVILLSEGDMAQLLTTLTPSSSVVRLWRRVLELLAFYTGFNAPEVVEWLSGRLACFFPFLFQLLAPTQGSPMIASLAMTNLVNILGLPDEGGRFLPLLHTSSLLHCMAYWTQRCYTWKPELHYDSIVRMQHAIVRAIPLLLAPPALVSEALFDPNGHVLQPYCTPEGCRELEAAHKYFLESGGGAPARSSSQEITRPEEGASLPGEDLGPEELAALYARAKATSTATTTTRVNVIESLLPSPFAVYNQGCVRCKSMPGVRPSQPQRCAHSEAQRLSEEEKDSPPPWMTAEQQARAEYILAHPPSREAFLLWNTLSLNAPPTWENRTHVSLIELAAPLLMNPMVSTGELKYSFMVFMSEILEPRSCSPSRLFHLHQPHILAPLIECINPTATDIGKELKILIFHWVSRFLRLFGSHPAAESVYQFLATRTCWMIALEDFHTRESLQLSREVAEMLDRLVDIFRATHGSSDLDVRPVPTLPAASPDPTTPLQHTTALSEPTTNFIPMLLPPPAMNFDF